MIKRDEYIFTIGYDGKTAIVDGSLKRQWGKLSSKELAENGLFKPALCSAIYNESQEEKDIVLQKYNMHSDQTVDSVENLMKTLGVYIAPNEIIKVLVI